MTLVNVAGVVFLLNVPFGYWRANVDTFSRQWFLSIHLPVPVVIALRIFSGLGWEFITFPVLIGAFFAGQLVGGWLHIWTTKYEKVEVSSCVFADLKKMINEFKT